MMISSNLSLAMFIFSLLPIHVGQLSVTDETPYAPSLSTTDAPKPDIVLQFAKPW